MENSPTGMYYMFVKIINVNFECMLLKNFINKPQKYVKILWNRDF